MQMRSYNSQWIGQFSIDYGEVRQMSARRSENTNAELAMEGRLGRMESDITYIKRDIEEIKTTLTILSQGISDIRVKDFRFIMGALISVAVGLAGVMAHGFHWL